MLAAAALGCGSGSSDVVTVDGSSTVYPITEAIAEQFQGTGKGRVTIGISGTAGGLAKLCQGELAVSGASRPIRPTEEQLCARAGIRTIELPIAYDGIAIVVHPDNAWVDHLEVEELRRMWEPAAQGRVLRWSDVRDGWPDEELHLFGPGVDSGTYDYFTEAIVGRAHASRGDFTSSEDDNVLVQGVSGDQNALGYFGYSYYENNRDSLKALALDGVEPSAETIRSGEYGLSRPIFIYVSTQALQNNDAVRPFVDFYLSEQNLDRLVEAARYVTLPGSLADESRAQYEDRTTGTVFTEEGEPEGGDLERALQQSQ